MPRFSNVELTPETIQATRQHFADIAQGCIDEVLSGAVKLPSHTLQADYFAQRRQQAKDSLEGKREDNVTFLQRAYWIQTGECIALLP